MIEDGAQSICSSIFRNSWMRSWSPLVIGRSKGSIVTRSFALAAACPRRSRSLDLPVHKVAVAFEVGFVDVETRRQAGEALELGYSHQRHRCPSSTCPQHDLSLHVVHRPGDGDTVRSFGLIVREYRQHANGRDLRSAEPIHCGGARFGRYKGCRRPCRPSLVQASFPCLNHDAFSPGAP